MTKKDYEAIAEVVGQEWRYCDEVNNEGRDQYFKGKRVQLCFLVDNLINVFKQNNPRFDEDRFRSRIGEVRMRGY